MIDKSKTIILTQSFPYGKGEEFIANELYYWNSIERSNFFLAPTEISGASRYKDIKIVNDLGKDKNIVIKKAKAIFAAIFSTNLYSEVLHAEKSGRLNFQTIRCIIRDVGLCNLYYRRLKKIYKRENFSLIYSYWNTTVAYAASRLKEDYPEVKLVGRAHRGDLYPDKKNSYMPLKDYSLPFFDQIFPISNDGVNELTNTWGIPLEKIKLMYLGVSIPKKHCCTSGKNKFRLLSVSWCSQVKRLDLIISLVSNLTIKNPEIEFTWHHLGGGDDLIEVSNYAKSILLEKNIKFKFFGHVTNDFVTTYYTDYCVDLFVNLSDSEGVPVSIMEAMSYGVPAIGFNVGGMSDILSIEHGFLFDKDMEIYDIVNFISKNMELIKLDVNRYSMSNHIKNRFDASKNYPEFINLLIRLKKK